MVTSSAGTAKTLMNDDAELSISSRFSVQVAISLSLAWFALTMLTVRIKPTSRAIAPTITVGLTEFFFPVSLVGEGT
jgi:hypothetical protein